MYIRDTENINILSKEEIVEHEDNIATTKLSLEKSSTSDDPIRRSMQNSQISSVKREPHSNSIENFFLKTIETSTSKMKDSFISSFTKTQYKNFHTVDN